MRNPNRLHTLYAELKRIHMTYCPDWRFGQFMSNVIARMGDTFYIEDDKIIERVEALFKKEENKTMFKVGQWIYGINAIDNDYGSAEVCGYLFMAECNEYIICCPEYVDDYVNYKDNFDGQLKTMYYNGIHNNGEVPVAMLRKELCFETKEQAEAELARLIEDFGLNWLDYE